MKGLSEFPFYSQKDNHCHQSAESVSQFSINLHLVYGTGSPSKPSVSSEWTSAQKLKWLMAFGGTSHKITEFFFISYLSEETLPWVLHFSECIKHKASALKINMEKSIKYVRLQQSCSGQTFVRVSFWWLCTYFHTGHMANFVSPRNQRGGTLLTC